MQKETLQVALAGLAGNLGLLNKLEVGINEQSCGLCDHFSNVITVNFKIIMGESSPVGNKAQ